MKKILMLVLAACMCASFTACNNSTPSKSSTPESTAESSVSQLSASPASMTLTVGSTQQITLSENGSAVSLKNYNFSSVNEKIAKVDPNGTVTGIMPGICDVKAFSTSDPTNYVSVIVTVVAGKTPEQSNVESSVQSDTESESSVESSTESSQESSTESSEESSQESSYAGGTIEAASIFSSDSASYDKDTLNAAHDIIKSMEGSGEAISPEGLTEDQAQLLINTIYATYGYEFGEGGEIRTSFDECDWYSAETGDSYQVMLNIGDHQNIKDSIDILGSYINSR